MGVPSTTNVLEKRGVEDVGDLRLREVELARESGADKAASQGVFGRKAKAHI
jgi:hypothetical protein